MLWWPGKELISISVGGTPYLGWKSCSVKIAARSPERSFQIVGAIGNSGPAAAAMAIMTNDVCVVTANGDELVTGKVHEIEIELNPEDHSIRISGKSRGADAVRSSVDHSTHEWKGKTPLQIAQSVDTSGIGYRTDETMAALDKVRCNIGDTPMKLLSKIIDKQGLFMTSDQGGGVLITKHGKHRHSGGIIEGDNFKSGTAKFSSENRVSKVKVKTHQSKGSDPGAWRGVAEAKDEGGRPGTTKVIVPKASMTKAEAQELADHVANNRHGDSVSLNCIAAGFRDQGGQIWRPGWLSWCEVPSCRLEQELALDEIELYQDDVEGTISRLTLVHPSALGGKAGRKGGKSAKGNSFGSWKGRSQE